MFAVRPAVGGAEGLRGIPCRERRDTTERRASALIDSGVSDLVVRGARCVATLDDQRREFADGWVAVRGGLIEAVGTGPAPAAQMTIDATDCLVTPGLVNTCLLYTSRCV